jgi:hypothetical protein
MVVNVRNVNPNKLHDELIQSGFRPLYVKNDLQEGFIAENTWITFADDTDMSAVQSIIDAHDPTPIQKELPLELRNRADIDYIGMMTGVL